ncbi:MAG: hypothetical protein IPF99_33685 [Deltaproteobacteria bacterium]|nr:hypothetical protein [Deltaproteobacteria bacterium]
MASWSPSGALRWARGFGGTLQDQCLGLAVDDAGSLWAGGNFSGTFTAGTQTVTASATGDVFLMRLTAADGAPQGLRRYGGTAGTFFDGVTARPDGAAVALHYLSPDLDVGLGSVGNAGSNDGLVVRVGLDLATRWQFRASSSSSESLSSIGFDAAGNVYFTGQAASTAVTFGTTGYTFGANDAYAVALSPTGALRWLTRFGSTRLDGLRRRPPAPSPCAPTGASLGRGHHQRLDLHRPGTLSVSAPALRASSPCSPHRGCLRHPRGRAHHGHPPPPRHRHQQHPLRHRRGPHHRRHLRGANPRAPQHRHRRLRGQPPALIPVTAHTLRVLPGPCYPHRSH